jgi:type II secretory pathway pseudopilin PulG
VALFGKAIPPLVRPRHTPVRPGHRSRCSGFSILEVVIACVVLSVMSLGILTSQISSARLVTEARELGTADRLLASRLSEVLLETPAVLCSVDTPFPFDAELALEPNLLREPRMELAAANWSAGDPTPLRLDLVLTLEWTNNRGQRVERSLATSHR